MQEKITVKSYFFEETMKKYISQKANILNLRLILIGLLSGLCNGLLGAGGGILIVFGMTPLVAHEIGAERDVFANALAVMLPVSLVSVFSYILSGRIPSENLSVYVLPAAIGGLIGALILDKMKLTLIKKLFAMIVIWSGVYMIMK